MGYAAYTKGTTALLTAILGMVEKEGVRAELARQWGDTFTEQTVRRVCANTAKAWRFVGEMQEIAATSRALACLVASTRQQPMCSSGWRNSRITPSRQRSRRF